MSYTRDGKKWLNDGTLPLDMRGVESYGLGDTWEAGEYVFKFKGLTTEKTEKGNVNALVDLECLKGPNDEDTRVGQHRDERFNVFSVNKEGGGKAIGFLRGFFEQLSPECVDPKNMVEEKGQLRIDMRWTVGTVFRAYLQEETSTTPDGRTIKSTRMNRKLGEVIERSAYAMKKGGNHAKAAASETKAASAADFEIVD